MARNGFVAHINAPCAVVPHHAVTDVHAHVVIVRNGHNQAVRARDRIDRAGFHRVVRLRRNGAGIVPVRLNVAVIIHPAEVRINKTAAIRGTHTVRVEVAVSAVRILPTVAIGL